MRLWITDFGLAHMASPGSNAGGNLTMTGDLVGTLRYMSPEQALAKRALVDHRTDIYSLGVTLYELLTLEPAIPGRDRQELLRQIAFEEPKPPRRINKSIPGELETIVLKAIEKNPEDRYATAQELADDLERYLKDEPIRAKRPTPMQRARKWSRRHQAAVRAAVVCLSVTLIALGSAIGWAVRDRLARDEGLDRAVDRILDDEAAPLIKEGKWHEALAAVQRADRLLAAADRAERPARLLDLQRELSLAERLEEIYGEPMRALKTNVFISSGDETGIPQYQAEPESSDEQFFQGQKQDQRFAQEFQDFGINVEALAPTEAAARIRQTSIRLALIQALDEWAGMRKRARGENDLFWKKLIEVAQLADPDDWRNRFRAALLRRDRPELEKLADTVPIKDVPPATASLLAFALKDLGAIDKAMTVLRVAHRHHAEDFWLNNSLGWLSRDVLLQRRYDDALRYFTAAAILRPHSGHAHWDLAVTLERYGNQDEAIAEYTKAIEMAPSNAVIFNSRGDLYRKLRQHDRALADYSKAVDLKPDFAEAWWDRATAYADLHQYDKALADQNKALELDPNNPWVWHNRGHIHEAMEQPTKALADFSQAVALDAKNTRHWHCRANAHSKLAQFDQAVEDFTKILELATKDPITSGRAWYGRAQAFADLGQWDKAIADFSKAEVGDSSVSCFCALIRLQLGDLPGYRAICTDTLKRRLHDYGGQILVAYIARWTVWPFVLIADSTTDWDRLVEVAQATLREDPFMGGNDDGLTLGAALYRAGRFAQAVERLKLTNCAWEQAKIKPATNYSPSYCWFFLAMAHHRLSHDEEARQWLDKATKQMEQETQNKGLAWYRRLTLQLLCREAEEMMTLQEEKNHHKDTKDTKKKASN
jgi:tetratricopeptide (TPR) repeat protein